MPLSTKLSVLPVLLLLISAAPLWAQGGKEAVRWKEQATFVPKTGESSLDVAFLSSERVVAAFASKVAPRKTISPDVQIWDVLEKKQVATLKGHQAPIEFVEFSDDGEVLVTQSMEGTVIVWRRVDKEWKLDKMHKVRRVRNKAAGFGGIVYHHGLHALRLLPDGKGLLLYDTVEATSKGVPNGGIEFAEGMHLLDLAGGKVRKLKDDCGATREGGPPQVSLAGKNLAVAKAGMIFVIDLEADRVVRKHAPPRAAAPGNPLFTADGKAVFYPSSGVIRRFELDGGKDLDFFDPADPKIKSRLKAVDPAGQVVAVATKKGLLKLLNAATGNEMASLPCDEEHFYTVRFAADGRALAVIWPQRHDGEPPLVKLFARE